MLPRAEDNAAAWPSTRQITVAIYIIVSVATMRSENAQTVTVIADLEALEDTLVRVSHLAMQLEGHLAELDINPLMSCRQVRE
jgi:hypothetical protein